MKIPEVTPVTRSVSSATTSTADIFSFLITGKCTCETGAKFDIEMKIMSSSKSFFNLYNRSENMVIISWHSDHFQYSPEIPTNEMSVKPVTHKNQRQSNFKR